MPKVFSVLSPDFNLYHSVLGYQDGINMNVSGESAVMHFTSGMKVLLCTAERNLEFILYGPLIYVISHKLILHVNNSSENKV